ncbi:uncharacterized protein BDR25DRAFT_361884 [Lindgomyces ingoldianus]|uniref:Uncharacterized protein n=1 Tax=Lindgomyces ingoldianus TaxID=673940 RepID=A0ACB6QCP0_9PLEO|nr:uncharacterized protein BDR25DRAFT_361884 [Lindgomyces ingoldianus]KAF2464142.1 hypothetical protein BDR25DRAFT_361884 [Lindgomyces ingoldianus]
MLSQVYVKLSAAINSMFRWYQNAVRCYVYLSDVSKPDRADSEKVWKEAFRTSRWFTQGWWLQELIAPRLVNFFSLEGERLRSKSMLKPEIHEITGIAKNALQGDILSNFSIKERRSRAEHRNTTIEEDGAYCLIRIFNVSMALIYRERRDQAFQRLEEEIHKLYKGVDFEQFAVKLNLRSFPEAAQFVATQFVAREQELLKMYELLHGHNSRAAVVLHGLGGIGKTQLAIEYVRRHKEKHTAIFWLNANDEDSLQLSFRGIAQQVLKYYPSTRVLSGVDVEGELDLVVNGVKAWLDLQGNTLDVRQYLPECDHGSIIITTRSARVTQGRRLHVQKLTGLKDGLKILANMSRRVGIESGVARLETRWPASRSLHGWGLPRARDHELRRVSPALLKLWAYFNKQDVWFRLLQHACSIDNKWIQKLTKDELSFNKAVQLLCEYGLAHPEPLLGQLSGSAGYGVHSCVHSWAISVLNGKWDDGLARLALTCVASEVPDTDVDKWWLLQRRLLQHAARHQHFIRNGNLGIEGTEWALHNLGMLYWNQGKLAEAEAMYDRALQGKEEALGPKHTSTLDTVNNLGNLYKNQGRLAEAEAMYDRALQGYAEAIRPELLLSYLPALNTMFSFGDLYEMYSRALAGYTVVQGPSSKWCEKLEDRLQGLQVVSAKLNENQAEFTEIKATKSWSLKRIFRRLGIVTLQYQKGSVIISFVSTYLSFIRATLALGSERSVLTVAVVRFWTRFPPPVAASSASGLAFTIFLASLAVFLAVFSAFAASFTTCSARAFSRSSYVITFAFPSIADLLRICFNHKGALFWQETSEQHLTTLLEPLFALVARFIFRNVLNHINARYYFVSFQNGLNRNNPLPLHPARIFLLVKAASLEGP